MGVALAPSSTIVSNCESMPCSPAILPHLSESALKFRSDGEFDAPFGVVPSCENCEGLIVKCFESLVESGNCGLCDLRA